MVVGAKAVPAAGAALGRIYLSWLSLSSLFLLLVIPHPGYPLSLLPLFLFIHHPLYSSSWLFLLVIPSPRYPPFWLSPILIIPFPGYQSSWLSLLLVIPSPGYPLPLYSFSWLSPYPGYCSSWLSLLFFILPAGYPPSWLSFPLFILPPLYPSGANSAPAAAQHLPCTEGAANSTRIPSQAPVPLSPSQAPVPLSHPGGEMGINPGRVGMNPSLPSHESCGACGEQQLPRAGAAGIQ